nr:ribonuclease H-like domain-containing protein [Tanacetum cinerariifolium]
MIENRENVNSRSDKGYHAVPPPYTGNYIPPKPDRMFIDEQVESESMDVVSNVSSSVVKAVESKVESVDVKNKGVYSTVETKLVKKNNFSPLIIEDYVSNDESEVEFVPKVEVKTVRPSIKKIKFVKPASEKVKKVETPKQHKHYPKGNQRNWNNLMSQRLGSNFKIINKACFVCGSFEHLHYVCDQKVVRPVWNNTKRVNHKNFANKMTHPHPKRRFISQAILTKSGKLKIAGTPVNTVRQVNTADSKPIMNYSRLISNAFKRGYSQSIRPFNKATHSRNSTRKKELLTVVALGRISGKGKIKTKTLDFHDVYFCKELKYNLFSVSQMCDKKNNVLFADTECLVLSSNFKLLDESQVLLRAPKKDNIYSVDLKSVVLTGGIKREFSVARTHQQNDVIERNNITLIEAVRTMVLVIKPHNKTPYELIRGRPLLIDFMKPFGYHVTILNTRDYLGKFDEKADEGFFVGYSVVIVAGFQTNGIARIKDNIVAGQAKKKKEPKQEYILIPICTTDPLISQGSKDSAVDARKKATEVDESQVSNNGGQDDQVTKSNLPVNTAGPSFVNAASPSPINVAGTPASTNAFKEHPFE